MRQDKEQAVVAPLSLIISGFAPVSDVRGTLTPQLKHSESSALYLLDLGSAENRLGGSCLSQVFAKQGGEPADLETPQKLIAFFNCIQAAANQGLLLAYHDRSDGGVLATVAEMMFAGHVGVDLSLAVNSNVELLAALFAEELGAVVQVSAASRAAFEALVAEHALSAELSLLGTLNVTDELRVVNNGEVVFAASRTSLHRNWSAVSYRMQAERDNPHTAQQQYDALLDANDPGLSTQITFDIDADVAAPFVNTGVRPSVAILREQGVNSHNEMAAAFHRAGFTPVDVHMTDLIAGRHSLQSFKGAELLWRFFIRRCARCGRWLGKSILFNQQLRDEFQAFFQREDSFALGVCNGCQMLAELKVLIPGSEHWPRFVRNRSEQFEARLSLVEVLESPSVLLSGMHGSRMPIAVSHGEGRAQFSNDTDMGDSFELQRVPIRFVNNYGDPAVHYPAIRMALPVVLPVCVQPTAE